MSVVEVIPIIVFLVAMMTTAHLTLIATHVDRFLIMLTAHSWLYKQLV